MATPILQIERLTTCLPTDTGLIRPVNDVSLVLSEGQTLALVGESGSGKSMLAFSVIRLLPANGWFESGRILWKGKNVLDMDREPLRRIRGKEIGFIFQEAGAALNPVRTIGAQLSETLRTHLVLSRAEARDRSIELLREVKIPEPERRVKDYPHQLSGGMKQRVLIAMAISCDPELVIADEPTTALDATLQTRILDLLQKLKEERKLAMLLITHDLALVRKNAERVAVMYAGRIVEEATTSRILEAPQHPYTEGLFESLPRSRGAAPGKRRLAAMTGTVPHLAALPIGCAFEPRCPVKFEPCHREVPSLAGVEDSGDHRSACYRNQAVLDAIEARS
ncbi:MAG TPA: ABC transporter ATP-binding protein [Vicinamibacteria bacterium]|nr:ABC transporter ATP-binding protein [Vicinamibacteria bacterium]